MDPEPIISVFKILIFLFSVIVHEVCHGLVALKFGDHTAERAGRLTLNPIPHIDPIGSILVPFFLYYSSHGAFTLGWAKPVPVNPLNFTDLRRGELFVSLAGVLANFGLALIGVVLYHITKLTTEVYSPQLEAFRYMIAVNLMLGVFNLVPIPPLDGSKVLMSQLSYKLAREYEKLSTFGPLLLMLFLYMGFLSPILNLVIITVFRLFQIY